MMEKTLIELVLLYQAISLDLISFGCEFDLGIFKIMKTAKILSIIFHSYWKSFNMQTLSILAKMSYKCMLSCFFFLFFLKTVKKKLQFFQMKLRTHFT